MACEDFFLKKGDKNAIFKKLDIAFYLKICLTLSLVVLIGTLMKLVNTKRGVFYE